MNVEIRIRGDKILRLEAELKQAADYAKALSEGLDKAKVEIETLKCTISMIEGAK